MNSSIRKENKAITIDSSTTMPFQDYSKMRPKYIKKEKEALKDEKNVLASTLLEVKRENNKLKEKFNSLTTQNQNLNKAVKELEKYLSKKLGYDKFALKEEVTSNNINKNFAFQINRTFS